MRERKRERKGGLAGEEGGREDREREYAGDNGETDEENRPPRRSISRHTGA